MQLLDKQTNESIRIRAAWELLRIVPHFWRVFAADLRRATMSGAPAQYGIMVMLAKRPHCMSEIAKAMMVSLPTISKGVRHLETRGLVVRDRDPSDRRRVYITLTQAGRGTLAAVANIAEARLLETMHGISDEDCTTLLKGLQVMRKLQVGGETVTTQASAQTEDQ